MYVTANLDLFVRIPMCTYPAAQQPRLHRSQPQGLQANHEGNRILERYMAKFSKGGTVDMIHLDDDAGLNTDAPAPAPAPPPPPDAV